MKNIKDIQIKVDDVWYSIKSKKLKSLKNIQACCITETMTKKELLAHYGRTVEFISPLPSPQGIIR
jgi:hypothetical protein